MHVHMHAHACAYACICMMHMHFMCMHMHMHVHDAYICIRFVCMRLNACVHAYECMRMHVYACVRMCVCKCVCTCMHRRGVRIGLEQLVNTAVVSSLGRDAERRGAIGVAAVRMHVYACVCMHACVRMHP